MIVPFGLTQIASSAELWLLSVVFVIRWPHTFSTPPPAVITAWMMFVLPDFSTPACVPQNPGVRQIVAPQFGGVGFAGTDAGEPDAHRLGQALLRGNELEVAGKSRE